MLHACMTVLPGEQSNLVAYSAIYTMMAMKDHFNFVSKTLQMHPVQELCQAHI